MSGSNTGKELKCSRNAGGLNASGKQLGEMVTELQSGRNLAVDILRAACCVLGAYTKNIRGDGGCDLLYYLVGSIVYKKLGREHDFGRTMNNLYKVLGQMLNTSECKIEDHTNGESLFAKMEQLHEYNLSPDGTWEEKGNPNQVNCGMCTNYLKEIAEACGKVKTYCRDPGNSHSCEGIGEAMHKHSPEYVLHLIYGIIPEFEGTLMEERKQEDENPCLNKLPSQGMYNKFQKDLSACSSDDSVEGMKANLRGDTNIEASMDYILNAWCTVSNIEVGNNLCDERWNFLYYWVGFTLSDTPVGDSFSGLMKKVYSTLGNCSSGSKCDIIHTSDVSRNFHQQMRTVHAYCQDYNTIEQQSEVSGNSCKEIYYTYLEGVSTAYKAVMQHCAQDTTKGYCQEFKRKYEKYGGPVLSDLMCSLKYTADCPTNNNHITTSAAAISSTLALLGLPAAAFFSYKVQLPL
ncbi:KIR-like protein [Plasmodium coatneyi]|uniref:KIR-like protein n=1 Tax=Plasmodium coatneyi TaxID=208452 RepID=A0A1B1E5D9_9APIC|nr:KIR-like protein [Plasmodium coatneyi]ANQ10244.1 KIR-like protein [Plasmodium coatneyi]